MIDKPLTESTLEVIYKNFDASYENQSNDYDILLGTDRISEGLNLNHAGMIINYDIPWNPVRVIQRVGRINRISKKVFNELYIINFFPTEMGSDLVRSREIAKNKMFLIHNALGEDAKIFDPDEEPTDSGLYQKLNQNPDIIEEESFYTEVLNEFEEIKKKNPKLIQELNQFPNRIKVSKRSENDELLVIVKKGRIFINYKDYQTDQVETKNLEEVFDKIKPENPEEKSIPLSDRFWSEYFYLKDYNENSENQKNFSTKSLEYTALNLLKNLKDDSQLSEYKDFMEMLIEDILDYGTLTDFTLKRIRDLEEKDIKAKKEELENLRKELGENYLRKIKEKIPNIQKEIIIAIENQNVYKT